MLVPIIIFVFCLDQKSGKQGGHVETLLIFLFLFLLFIDPSQRL